MSTSIDPGQDRPNHSYPRHSYHCPLRWGDMDAQAHVNNAAWVDYLQEARVDFLLRGPLAAMLDSGVLVVSHAVEYLAPLVADGSPLRIELWIDTVGGARFSIAYELFHHDQLVGRARTVVTPYDLERASLRRLTEQERAALRDRVIPTEPLRRLPSGELTNPSEFPLQVRWSDLDSYGHVNNVMFYEYAQEARIALLGTEFATDDGLWLVVRQDMHYLRPMPFRLEPFATRIGVIDRGRSSITLATEMADPGEESVFARAGTVLVYADLQGRPQPLPPTVISQLSSRGV